MQREQCQKISSDDAVVSTTALRDPLKALYDEMNISHGARDTLVQEGVDCIEDLQYVSLEVLITAGVRNIKAKRLMERISAL